MNEIFWKEIMYVEELLTVVLKFYMMFGKNSSKTRKVITERIEEYLKIIPDGTTKELSNEIK